MRYEPVWTWGANADLQGIYASFEEHQETSGDRFVGVVERLIKLLTVFPELAPVWRGSVRRAVIRRSNHGLFYVVEGRRLVIVAVQALTGDPEVLEEEIRGRIP